jgi:hypothetical protein
MVPLLPPAEISGPWKVDGRVTTAAGDFFTDPLQKADVVTTGLILPGPHP